MVKVKGCNMFPSQIEEVLQFTDGASSEYQVMIEAINGRDVLTVLFETPLEGEERERCEQQLAASSRRRSAAPPRRRAFPWVSCRAARRSRSASSTPVTKACKQVERKRSRAYQPLAPVQVVLGKEFCLLATSEEEIIFRVCIPVLPFNLYQGRLFVASDEIRVIVRYVLSGNQHLPSYEKVGVMEIVLVQHSVPA